MTIPVNSTLLKNHFLAYGFVPAGQPNQGASIPLAVDQNGVMQVAVSSGGHTGVVIEVNADDESVAQFALLAASFAYGYNSVEVGWDRLQSGAANADALAPVATGNLLSIAQLFGWDGAAFDRMRLANIFHTVVATALGSTAVWTPTAGKKFRLMGYTISVSGTLAAAGTQTIELLDSATVIKNHLATLQTTVTGDSQMGADLGQGQLSAAANNVLNVNLSTVMASGGVAVNVWGTEE